jgi:hypothetical protein
VLDQIVIYVLRYRKGVWSIEVEEWEEADRGVGSVWVHSRRRLFLVVVDRKLIVKAD